MEAEFQLSQIGAMLDFLWINYFSSSRIYPMDGYIIFRWRWILYSKCEDDDEDENDDVEDDNANNDDNSDDDKIGDDETDCNPSE